MAPHYKCKGIMIYRGDCREVMKTFGANCVDAIVTDPPYGLEFMGKEWDRLWDKRANTEYRRKGFGAGVLSAPVYEAGIKAQQWHYAWAIEALRVAKPGAHLLAFGGTRTFHRLACAIEDAGWEIRDCVMWLYGSGFPKSLDVSKAIDKAAGVEREVIGIRPDKSRASKFGGGETAVTLDSLPATSSAREWSGWGTALKPAWEPIIVARKPLEGTVAENVQKHGTGAMNIDGCRVGTEERFNPPTTKGETVALGSFAMCNGQGSVVQGRWPANLIHDGSDEVVKRFPDTGISSGGKGAASMRSALGGVVYSGGYAHDRLGQNAGGLGDSGSAARFFYTAKASSCERGDENTHPTVKPVALMKYLIKLVTHSGGIVLDPFMGSGSTLAAARRMRMRCVGIEVSDEYIAFAVKRLDAIKLQREHVLDI
jgi:site-specific DNA-methyltransferase (adenine-specific)